jgi:methionyl-tRNA synthetase
VAAANKYIQDQQPWTLAKARTAGGADAAAADQRLRTVLYNLLESIRLTALSLAAFLPQSADAIASQLSCEIKPGDFTTKSTWGTLVAGTPVKQAELLFQKLDEPKDESGEAA